MTVGPYMAYILYIVFYPLYKKKRGFRGPKNVHEFLAVLAIKMAVFF